jgi:ABC-2 type transport system ATP-binding protein
VFATSYLDEAERAVSVLALDDGRVLGSGTPQEIVAAMPGTLRVSDTRPEGEARRRAWRRGGRWQIWDPPGQPGPPITDFRHQNPDEPDMIMTKSHEKRGGPPNQRDQPDRAIPAGSAGGAGDAVAPDLQDAVTVAILARELADGQFPGDPEGGGPR